VMMPIVHDVITKSHSERFVFCIAAVRERVLGESV